LDEGKTYRKLREAKRNYVFYNQICMFLLMLPASNGRIVTAEPLNFLRLTVVSSTTESPAQKYNGTKFFLDEWCKRLPKVRGLCFG